MKRNQFFNILEGQHFKDTIPKFEPCLKKIGDFKTPENFALKNGLQIAWPKCPGDVVLRKRLPDYNTIQRVLAVHNINILIVI